MYECVPLFNMSILQALLPQTPEDSEKQHSLSPPLKEHPSNRAEA